MDIGKEETNGQRTKNQGKREAKLNNRRGKNMHMKK